VLVSWIFLGAIEVTDKSSIDILTESLLSRAKDDPTLNSVAITEDHIKDIISILRNEQFSEDNRKNSRLLIDKILDEIIEHNGAEYR